MTRTLAFSIGKTIQVGITCKDIRQDLSIGNNSKELIEGFVVIRADPNAGVLGLQYYM